jgi:hypothetical protein
MKEERKRGKAGSDTHPTPRGGGATTRIGLPGRNRPEVPGPHPGRPAGEPRPAPPGDSLIKRWVIEGPAKQGLDRANWTHEELADHLYKARGIRTSRSAMQRYCQKVGIAVYRPTYHYERGNPEKQAQAKQDIAELKQKRRRERSSC